MKTSIWVILRNGKIENRVNENWGLFCTHSSYSATHKWFGFSQQIVVSFFWITQFYQCFHNVVSIGSTNNFNGFFVFGKQHVFNAFNIQHWFFYGIHAAAAFNIVNFDFHVCKFCSKIPLIPSIYHDVRQYFKDWFAQQLPALPPLLSHHEPVKYWRLSIVQWCEVMLCHSKPHLHLCLKAYKSLIFC